MIKRIDGRERNELRPVSMIPGYVIYPEGSVLISTGNTRVLCNATVEEMVPRWMINQKVEGGWVTGEYSLLPRSTQTRTPREINGLSGRTQEIKRLIGRSLRASVDLKKLGQRTITLDCDVLQADGGTRTAAITGAYVALALAIQKLIEAGAVKEEVLLSPVAGISAGIVGGEAMLDLCYEEDSHADVDINVVMNGKGEYIEVQSTAEGNPFTREKLNEMLDLASEGIRKLMEMQQEVIKGVKG